MKNNICSIHFLQGTDPHLITQSFSNHSESDFSAYYSVGGWVD